MFNKILIANRGEIACRVARTCRRMGIRTVAVYSEADVRAQHVNQCDEAWLLGPAPARESYLRADRIIDIARESGAEAIHPGYGFLSENAEFAETCSDAGIVFIGPPPQAIRDMGSKSRAKTIMESAEVPLVPGYHGDSQEDKILLAAAHDIGFPVLIKAVSGGGGKGMRRVDEADALHAAIASARREAAAAFGDDRLLVEKYLLEPRHVEMQVFADQHGNAVHLFERDCSIQRRHQKIIEEAPAPGIDPARRRRMGQAAVAAARAIDYLGAGTVEFITDQAGEFYFMEMNTRLQVEHPVTEMITGLDLVEWQLRVASGEPLPRTQDEIEGNGHAFEARIYAEDPSRDFLPATGRLDHLQTPPESPYVRIDTGVQQGDAVGIHYDPMIAKLVVWDQNRADALRRLREALSRYEIVGVTTNLEFLAAVAAQPSFAGGAVSTAFIEQHHTQLFPGTQPASDHVLAVATLSELLRIEEDARAQASSSADPWSPWHNSGGWRLNDDNHHTLQLREGDREITVTAHYRPDHYELELPNRRMRASAKQYDDDTLRVDLDGLRFTVTVVRQGELITVIGDGRNQHVVLHDPLLSGLTEETADNSLCAPMPGTIVDVRVAEGDTVKSGEALVVLEAMKMEHTISAASDGVIESVHYGAGEQVEEGAELITLKGQD